MAIIEDIERRLLNWARWKLGGQAGGLGFAHVDLMGALADRDNYHEAVIPTAGPEASETDAAVLALPSELRAVVEAWYLKGGTLARKAEKLCVHVETVKRRRWDAHKRIQVWLADKSVLKRAAAAR